VGSTCQFFSPLLPLPTNPLTYEEWAIRISTHRKLAASGVARLATPKPGAEIDRASGSTDVMDPVAERLLHGMQHTGDRWLSADTRDFIAVFAR